MTYNTQSKVQQVADLVIKRMEEVGTDWLKPFGGNSRLGNFSLPHNLSGRNYSGINLFWLQMFNPYECNTWATYKQIQDAGGQVVKGEKATPVFYYGVHTKTETVDGKDVQSGYKFLKSYSVFNLQQTTIKDLKPVTVKPKSLVEKLDDVEQYIKNTKAVIKHESAGQCYYVPSQDYINMSPLDTWKAVDDITKEEAYYSTILHELVHWTGHKSRLDRLSSGKKNSLSYAEEELVAELGSAILCNMLQVSKKPSDQHAKYLNGWISRIKDKPKALFSAMAHAQRSITFIEELQPKEAKNQSKIEQVA
jgi:antirestriction protein ArdC